MMLQWCLITLIFTLNIGIDLRQKIYFDNYKIFYVVFIYADIFGQKRH